MRLTAVYIFTMMLLVLVCFPMQAHAKKNLDALFDSPEQYGLDDHNRVAKQELESMRGGLRIGSLNFDFAITTRTLVDGVIQHTGVITSEAFGQTMQDVTNVLNSSAVPTNVGNQVVNTIANNVALITTIQNSADNALIQQFNQVDVNISNLAAVHSANVAAQLNAQAAQALR